MGDRLLISGKKLFYKKGYFKTKVKDITDDIGASAGHFYTYYDSKEVLLKEILKSELKVLKNGFEISSKIQGDLSDVLENFFYLALNFTRDMMPLYLLKIELEENIEKLKTTTFKLITEYNNLLEKYIEKILINNTKKTQNLKITTKLITVQINTFIKFLIEDDEIEYLSEKGIRERAKKLTTLALATCDIFELVFESENRYDELTGVYSEKYTLSLLEKLLAETRENESSIFIVYSEKLTEDKGEFFKESILKEISTHLKQNTKSEDVIGRIKDLYFIVYMENIKNRKALKSIEIRFENLFKNLEKKYFSKEEDKIKIISTMIKKEDSYKKLKDYIDKTIEKNGKGAKSEQ